MRESVSRFGRSVSMALGGLRDVPANILTIEVEMFMNLFDYRFANVVKSLPPSNLADAGQPCASGVANITLSHHMSTAGRSDPGAAQEKSAECSAEALSARGR
jgi:hypothetical protein